MRKFAICAWFIFSLALLTCWTGTREASAETRVYFNGGTWIPFLPDYTAASIVESGTQNLIQPDLLRDDQIDVGTQLGLTGFHRLERSGRLLEVDLNIAGIGSMGANGTFADPGPTQSVWLASLDGFGFLSTPNGETATFSLDSDVLHYSEYIGLRDLFTTRRFGDVELGIGFGHMGFEQSFQLDALLSTGASGQYVEDLDTTYLGGEIRGRITRDLRGNPIIFDFGIGLYDMDADYEGVSVLRAAAGGGVFDLDQLQRSIGATAMTLDLSLQMETDFRGVLLRPGINFKYISDMPVINHPMTEVAPTTPVTLDTDPGYFLGVNLEILLCCRNKCCSSCGSCCD